jgi:hypothetical protein
MKKQNKTYLPQAGPPVISLPCRVVVIIVVCRNYPMVSKKKTVSKENRIRRKERKKKHYLKLKMSPVRRVRQVCVRPAHIILNNISVSKKINKYSK